MKHFAWLFIFCCLNAGRALATGYDIKTSDIIDQPGVEVLGDYQGSWYAIGFEKPGTLQKPPRYKIFKYAVGVRDGKSSPMYPSFGEKTIYLKSAIIAGKICMFYGKCEHLAEKTALHDSLEGRSQIDSVFRQDYDPLTLAPVEGPKLIFCNGDDRFSASGIDIATSEDKSKTAVLIKCWYKHLKYKLFLTDNKTGELFAKVFTCNSIKQGEYLRFLKLRVNNNGEVLIETKLRTDVITLARSTLGKDESHYYFFAIDKTGGEPKVLDLNSPDAAKRYFDEPAIAMLNNGETIIAYDFFAAANNPVVKGIVVCKYDAGLSQISNMVITPDTKLAKTVADYQMPKKEPAFSYLETRQVFPLEDGNFMLIAEYRHAVENHMGSAPMACERGYLLTYRIDSKLAVNDAQFIPKKQSTAAFDYALSVQAFRKGNDVYLFHNDDWEGDGTDDGMSLQCTKLLFSGTGPNTQKIVHTSDDFFPCMDYIFFNSAGKVLIPEEKSVDFEDVSREVKLLEVTVK